MDQSARDPRQAGGFTLVEVLLALGILFTALVVCLSGSIANVEATNRAKLLSAATGLASSKMLDLEVQLYKEGFSDIVQELSGDFADEGLPRYTWDAQIEKVTLPSFSQTQSAATSAQEAAGGAGGAGAKAGAFGSTDQVSPSDGLGSSMMGAYFEVISKLLENSIRKVVLNVHWKAGKVDETLTLVCYFADYKALDKALVELSAMISGLSGGPPKKDPPK